MRYFFISYNYDSNTGSGVGWTTMKNETFPSATEIDKKIENKYISSGLKTCIQNLFEFKNEEDYNNFKK